MFTLNLPIGFENIVDLRSSSQSHYSKGAYEKMQNLSAWTRIQEGNVSDVFWCNL